MTVEFWFISGDDKFRLPVNPATNQWTSPFDYEDFEVEGIGEVSTIKRRSLISAPFETHFPAKYNSTYCGYKNFPSPQQCFNKFVNWRNKREPIRMIVTGEGGFNKEVTIRDITVNANRSGEPGDIYVSIDIKEHRTFGVTTVDLSKPNQKPPTNGNNTNKRPPAPAPKKVTSYVVKKDESLSVIAKKKEIYGDANKWRTIYNANKKVIGTNPNKIKPGMKLVIPR